MEPRLARWKLREGDALLVYSDGLTEQQNADGEEFGETRLAKACASAIAAGETLEAAVPRAIEAFKGRTPQQDDMSMLVLSLTTS
jgi:sigma-B regulation protein RsbU (phosphoserine phosphatase)